MKRLNKTINLLLIVAMLFTQLPVVQAAGSATVNLNGSSTATTGSNIELTVALANVTGAVDGVAGFQANVAYDAEYLEFVSYTGLTKFSVDYDDSVKMIAGVALTKPTRVTDSSFNLIKLVFKTKKKGNTTVTIKDTEVSAGNNDILSTGNASKSITIDDPVPKSTNANLSALGVSSYDLTPTFDKNTTEYRVSVPYSVGRITITATPEDSKAKVSGTGGANLNADADNPFTVTCTAEDNVTKKQYKLIIHREKAPEVPKSTDNTLKSLGVSGFTMSPSFNKDTTEYNVTDRKSVV